MAAACTMLAFMSMPRRVVYIEDNVANLALVTKVLGHVGYVVEGAETGEEGLEAVEAAPPDLILLDLDLPGIDGFAVVRLLKANVRLAVIPVIAISASVMKQERKLALESGCVAFVEKPFDISELRVAVEEALASSTSQS